MAGNSVLVLLALIVVAFVVQHGKCESGRTNKFIGRNGTDFTLDGKSFYLNGFNAYWLMYKASDPSSRFEVTKTFQEASLSDHLNVARTWAFSDGGYRPLQISPGFYNEDMFKGLDFVISEASKYGVKLILSLVNNWNDFGGKAQYVQWAKERGQYISKDDDFFTHPIVKQYYKNHVKSLLTRINSITQVAYKDDPIIFGWELMNEPRYQSNNSYTQIQEWVGEMAAYVKSIDEKHLLEIGLEGFYGETIPDRKKYNPAGYTIGTDFISNNQIPQVDFATIHLYNWLNASDEVQDAFVDNWVNFHIQDSNNVLKKPILIAEFGMSSTSQGYNVEKRDNYYRKLYNMIYNSAKSGGPCKGGIFWQLMIEEMKEMGDGYEVILAESPSTAKVILEQSQKLSSLT